MLALWVLLTVQWLKMNPTRRHLSGKERPWLGLQSFWKEENTAVLIICQNREIKKRSSIFGATPFILVALMCDSGVML